MTAPAPDRSHTDQSHTERKKMTVSERSIPALTGALQRWLEAQPALPGKPTVSGVRAPDSNGLSSTSLLFDVSFAGEDGVSTGSYVARMAPEDSAFPVFPRYDLPTQYEVISRVADACPIPLPQLRWNVPDSGPLGAPFFVMDRIEGRVPLDNPPYVFTGWVLEATPEERARLQQESVEILARLHAMPAESAVVPALHPPDGCDALRHHVAQQRDYYCWGLAGDGLRVPIIERSLDWLEEHWPADPGPPILTWGDARIGNIIYQGFTPAAVLDWEMAAIGPRELDVSWFIFLHRFFQDIAEFFGLEGLPDFLRRSDVERAYRDLTGWQLRDMDFYLTYAAFRHAIVMARIRRRMIHFGEDEVPADPDDYVMHRASLERMLAGTYRWD
jgi:aminoglycoside phosphotransferase (APT) family kinase protein